jgi:hypothetical protein
VIWGALNGFYLLFGVWTNDLRASVREKVGLAKNEGLLKAWQVLATFLLVCFAWIFFRSKNIHDAFYIVTQLPYGWRQIGFGQQIFQDTFGFPRMKFLYSMALIGILIVVHMVQNHGSIRHMLARKPAWVRWSFYYLLVVGMVVGGEHGRNPFIYFQF